jgi:hypothetical protein
MKISRVLAVPLLVVAAFVLVACGSSSGGKTTTVVTVIEKDSSSGGSATTDNAAEDSSGTDGDSVSDEGTGGNADAGEIVVPDEVGKNHQAAQDDLQAHGLYNLSEEDATGQGRMLILDRNWQVVSQSPSAGTKVAEDATITLLSKKYTD